MDGIDPSSAKGRLTVNTFRKVLLGIPFLAIALTASAQLAQTGTSICRQIEKSVNTLADFTQTSCAPGAGVAKGSLSFIVLSSKPVFAVESSKKAWLITVVGAAGNFLNDSKTVKA